MTEQDLQDFLGDFGFYMTKQSENTYVIREIEFDSLSFTIAKDENFSFLHVAKAFSHWYSKKSYDSGYHDGKLAILNNLKKALTIAVQ